MPKRKTEVPSSEELFHSYEKLLKNNTNEEYVTDPDLGKFALLLSGEKQDPYYNGGCYAGMKGNPQHLVVVPYGRQQVRKNSRLDHLMGLIMEGDLWGKAILNPDVEHAKENGWWMDMSYPWQRVWTTMLVTRTPKEKGVSWWITRETADIVDSLKTPEDAEDFLYFRQVIRDGEGARKAVSYSTSYHGCFMIGSYMSYPWFRSGDWLTHHFKFITEDGINWIIPVASPPPAYGTHVHATEPTTFFCNPVRGMQEKSIKDWFKPIEQPRPRYYPTHTNSEYKTVEDCWNYFLKNKEKMK